MWFRRRAGDGTDPAAIVSAALRAFRARPDAAPADLVADLQRAGVPHADRAVALLPIAFGRLVLDGLVALPATFHDGQREIPFAEDPLYRAAEELARTQVRHGDIDDIAFRSAEVAAVNQALNAGSRPEDLLLTPPRVILD
jgi:hypothetical protein